MNLPALSSAIVHAVRNSMQDSAHNQATVVAGMIREELDKCLKDPAAVWVNMLRGEIARPQALDHYEQCKNELEQVQNALDNYWREHPTTLAAVEAVMRDVNNLRIQQPELPEIFALRIRRQSCGAKIEIVGYTTSKAEAERFVEGEASRGWSKIRILDEHGRELRQKSVDTASNPVVKEGS